MKERIFAGFLFFLISAACFAQNRNESQYTTYTAEQQRLRIRAEDVRLVPEKDKSKGGYHLYVRKLPNVNSIMLTETAKDPSGVNDSYAYRAKEYNPINGDEIRYLDGKPLVSDTAKYSLMDSTPEETDFFGPAFHIYIPETIVYGHEWTRNGEVTIGKGTFINIRSFEKPYGDYSGAFMDSPFMFDLKVQKRPVKAPEPPKAEALAPQPARPIERPMPELPPIDEPVVMQEEPKSPVVEPPAPEPNPEPDPEPEPPAEEPVVEEETILIDDYNPVASEKFKEISEQMLYSKGEVNLVDDICAILDGIANKEKLDVVFAIDATGSMKNDIDKLKSDLIPVLLEKFHGVSGTRFGLLFYRDYGDTFRYMDLPVKMYSFTTNLNSFNRNLNALRINGKEGGDIPEAVYEAIYASSAFYAWREDSQKLIILIGDAEPHPAPRNTGKYSKDYVMSVAAKKGIKIHSILLPKD